MSGKSYEYKFERINAGLFGLQKAEKNYQSIIQKHGQDGWRLVQVFAPSGAGLGGTRYYEMIFEREKYGE